MHKPSYNYGEGNILSIYTTLKDLFVLQLLAMCKIIRVLITTYIETKTCIREGSVKMLLAKTYLIANTVLSKLIRFAHACWDL